MADTTTANYGLVKPEVGASNDTWGQKTNGNWDIVDVKIKFAIDATAGAMPKTGGQFTGDVRGTSFRGIPTGNIDNFNNAQQLIAGESTDNAAYRLKIGYWNPSNAWRGVIDVIANNSPANLDIQPNGGGTYFGGPVRMIAAVGTPQSNLGGVSPILTFTNLADTVRFGLIQHGGAGQPMLIQNDQGSTIRFATGGGDVAVVTPGGFNVTGDLNATGRATATGGLFVDSGFYMNRPTAALCDIGYDANDVVRFDRNANQWNWFVGGVSIAGLNSSVLTHGGDITAGRDIVATRNIGANGAMYVQGNEVFHRGNLNPGAYALLGTGVSFSSVRINANNGGGVVYFGDTDTYIQYDNATAAFVFVKGGTVCARISDTFARFRGEVFGNMGAAT